MDIPQISMALSNSKLQQQVDLSLMRKVMDTSETKANNLIKMLETSTPHGQATHPYLGKSIDIKL